MKKVSYVALWYGISWTSAVYINVLSAKGYVHKYLVWVCISGKEPKFGFQLAETWYYSLNSKSEFLAFSIICGGAKTYIVQCQIEVVQTQYNPGSKGWEC